MTLEKLIKELTALAASGVPAHTEVFITTDSDGTFSLRSVHEAVDEAENYPDDWNMPDHFIELLG